MSDSSRAELLERIRKLENAARPLDPGSNRRKKLRGVANASIERFLRRVDQMQAFVGTGDKGVRLLETPIGEHGVSMDEAIEVFERDVMRPGAGPATPGHLAYIPGGGLYHSALGDFLAAVSNKYASVFFAGPGAVRMENMLIRWVADLVGYPSSAGGTILSGGSIANLTAIVAARDARGLKGADYASAVVYLTRETHHSIQKALRIAGMVEAPVRYVAIDDRSRMRVDALRETIDADRRAGLRPWLIVGSGGTTDTGAVDPLDAIADVAKAQGCWFHVDAAYGGFFLLTETGRSALRGIERSDSAVLDPHKGLFLPYGSGIVVARDAANFIASNQYSGAYMQDILRDPSETSPADLSPELTKHFRALRMWLPLVVLGLKPFRAALEEKLLLAHYFRDEIQAAGFEVGPSPDLSIVTFRWAPDGVDLAEANRVNRVIVDGMRNDGRIFLSSTMIDHRYTIRMVSLAFRTHRRTIDLAVRLLREQLAAAKG